MRAKYLLCFGTEGGRKDDRDTVIAPKIPGDTVSKKKSLTGKLLSWVPSGTD